MLLLSLILFPFFPTIYGLSRRDWKITYKDIEPVKRTFVVREIGYEKLDTVPIDMVIKFGSVEQKKRAVQKIYELVEKLELEADKAVGILNTLIKIEASQDVILYSTEYLEQIEDFLLIKIKEFSNKLDKKDGLFNFARFSYQYAKTSFLVEEQKVEVLNFTRKRIERAPEEFFDRKLVDIYLDILFMLNDKESYKKVLEKFSEFYTPVERSLLESYAERILKG